VEDWRRLGNHDPQGQQDDRQQADATRSDGYLLGDRMERAPANRRVLVAVFRNVAITLRSVSPASHVLRGGPGRDALVVMMQPTGLWKLNHAASVGGLDLRGCGRSISNDRCVLQER
jgi:hypothetical protein